MRKSYLFLPSGASACLSSVVLFQKRGGHSADQSGALEAVERVVASVLNSKCKPTKHFDAIPTKETNNPGLLCSKAFADLSFFDHSTKQNKAREKLTKSKVDWKAREMT
jgi:hypothetical protein